jgi:hypothetical protein
MMLPIIPKPPITAAQKRAAVAVAGTIDLLQLVVFPLFGLGVVLDEALDVIAAIVLTAICGFKWQFAVAFALELVPIADLLPTWTAVVLLLGSTSPTVQASGAVRGGEVVPPPRQPVSAEAGVVDVEAVSVPPVRVQTSQ